MERAFRGDTFSTAGHQQDIPSTQSVGACISFRPEYFEAWLTASAVSIIVGFNKVLICPGLSGYPLCCISMFWGDVHDCYSEFRVLQIQSPRERSCSACALYEYNLWNFLCERCLSRLQQKEGGLRVQVPRNTANHPFARHGAEFPAQTVQERGFLESGYLPLTCRIYIWTTERFFHQIYSECPDPGADAGRTFVTGGMMRLSTQRFQSIGCFQKCGVGKFSGSCRCWQRQLAGGLQNDLADCDRA